MIGEEEDPTPTHTNTHTYIYTNTHTRDIAKVTKATKTKTSKKKKKHKKQYRDTKTTWWRTYQEVISKRFSCFFSFLLLLPAWFVFDSLAIPSAPIFTNTGRWLRSMYKSWNNNKQKKINKYIVYIYIYIFLCTYLARIWKDFLELPQTQRRNAT